MAQHHQPPIGDRYQPGGIQTSVIVGVSIGLILLFFLASASAFYAKRRRREASRGRAERGRVGGEFTIAPLAAPVVVAPPPYENPPSFEDSVKRTQTASATPTEPREGEDERNGVVG